MHVSYISLVGNKKKYLLNVWLHRFWSQPMDQKPDTYFLALIKEILQDPLLLMKGEEPIYTSFR